MLSDIENGIRRKIESIGIQLKDWEISINYGIKTGFNEAFIITKEQRDGLIILDPKSEEIIRPLLRGRDIKRYHYEYPDLYLIATFPSLKINIDHYSAVKQHLLSFGYDRLKQTGDKGARKKTNNKWFETQDSISYWEDFFKQKLLWAETMRIHKNTSNKFPRFGFDDGGELLTDKTCFFATGPNIKYIMAILNSTLGRYLCSQYVSILDDGGYLMQKIYLEKIPIPTEIPKVSELTDQLLIEGNSAKINRIEEEIDSLIFSAFQLAPEEISFIHSTLQ